MASVDDIKKKLAGLKNSTHVTILDPSPSNSTSQELLASEVITQEDFEREKKALLGLFVNNNKDNNTKNSENNNIKDITNDDTKDNKHSNKVASTTTTTTSDKSNTQDFLVTSYVDPNDASLVWCGMNISFPTANGGHITRKKVIILLLDRSGSMSQDWPIVVQSVRLVAPSLLADPDAILKVIVYAHSAAVVDFPDANTPTDQRVEALCQSLSTTHKPTDQITVFMSAFRAATRCVKTDILDSSAFSSFPPANISVSVLLFTDGKDTSIWNRGKCDAEESATSARKHFDIMRDQLNATGCGIFYYIAAYTAQHDPTQCQYFSDKYKYIDRAETLTAHLSSLVSYTLAEELPDQLPLNSEGKLDYYIWLKSSSSSSGNSENSKNSGNWIRALRGAHIVIEAHSIGMESRFFDGRLDVQNTAPRSLSHHIYVLDRAAFWLRKLSREIIAEAGNTGERAQQIQVLRSTLDLVRRETHDSRTLALKTPSTGPTLTDSDRLEFMRAGTAARSALKDKPEIARVHRALVARLDLVDTLANRLSHVVGEYEKNTINGVRISAILADSQQHLPLAVQRMLTGEVTIANAARIRAKEEVLAGLPPHTTKLSTYGEEFTTDMFGQINAADAACSSDAHFFYLSSVTSKTKVNLQLNVKSSKDGIGFVSLAAFTFLKESGMKQKQGVDYVVRGVGADEVANVWLPCYFTQEHFRRGLLLYPDALGRLAFNDPLSFSWLHYQVPFEIFGRSAVSEEPKKEVEWVLFLHKTRALFEFARATVNEKDGKSFLQHAEYTFKNFLERPALRGKDTIRSLYSLISYAFLMDLTKYDVVDLLQKVYLEIIARCVRWVLKKNARSSQTVTGLLQSLLGLANPSTSTAGSNNQNINISNNNNSNNNSNSSTTTSAITSTPWMGVFAQSTLPKSQLLDAMRNAFPSSTPNACDTQPSAPLDLLSDVITRSKQLGKLSSCLSLSEWAVLADNLQKWKELQQKFIGLQGVFEIIDASLTQPDGESKIQSLVGAMKAPSLPPPLPSPLRIRATALATAVSFLPTSANTHEVPAHAAWVRKGAALVIQRAYRAWMKRRGEKRHQKTGLCGGCTPAYAARWWSADPATDARARAIIARGVPALFSQMMRAVKTQLEQEERERVAREKQARKQAKTIAERWEQVQRHRIMLQPQTQSSGDCWFCGKTVGNKHMATVWGRGAEPEDEALYANARQRVLERQHYDDVISIDSHTEKEYRAMGGRFRFPDPQNDTFIRGLHARIIKLRVELSRSQEKKTTEEAVAEMLMRLRWDDRIPGAKEKLERIVTFLWEAVSGTGPPTSTLPSTIAPHHHHHHQQQ